MRSLHTVIAHTHSAVKTGVLSLRVIAPNSKGRRQRNEALRTRRTETVASPTGKEIEMKRMIAAIALTTATAAPAAADMFLDGTVVSSMGDANIVALHPRERGIGDNGYVTAQDGDQMRLSADRILQQREQARVDGNYVTGYTFASDAEAVTQYGAR